MVNEQQAAQTRVAPSAAGSVGPLVVPVVTSISPAVGPTTGGTVVTITGTGFTGATAVTFGGTPATSFTVNSDNQITATTPARPAGVAQVVVTTPGGTSNNPVFFVYQAPPVPTVAFVSPASGPTTGGTVVTIFGTGFNGATAVTFGGTPATSFTVNSNTQITAVTPARPAGLAQVRVTTPGGTSTSSVFFLYIQAAPTVTSVSPTSGPTTGGTVVTITGTGFTGATSVTFGGTPATSFTVNSDTQITATTPARPAGPAQVVVTTPAGSSTNPVFFTYVTPAPTVASVSPTSGPTTGGTVVTITGTGFTGATSVTFGGTPATSFIVNSNTQITAVTPAHAAGPAQVVVTTPGGSSTDEVFFTYVTPAPTVTNVVPNTGPTTGGTVVTITGTGFTGATSVTFGGTPATSFTVNSDTQITATTPANAAGPAQVVVTTPAGSSTNPVFFTYVTPAPTVTDVEPDTGPTTGGTEVTITGTGFTGATAVTFGGTPATSFTVNSDTQITATTPARPAGPAQVVVTTPAGSSTDAVFFTYVTPAPTVTNVVPDTGPTTGGTVVTITGTGFSGATSVTFGGTPATSFIVNSDTQITATTPANAAGPAQVVVTTPGGSSTDAVFFTYVTPAPTVTNVVPNTGPTTGGTEVTITGTGFTGATAVTFGGTPATSFTINSDTQITATTPANAAGPAQVVVTTPGGSSTDEVFFTYVTPAPTVASVSPTSGPTTGGTVVTISGTGFTGATGVTFGGVPATSFTINSDTQITATTPANAAGPAQVVVTTPAGSSTDEVFFTYVTPAPTVTDVEPDTGPTTGGTVVTISGTGFTGATGVTFGGVPATSFIVNSDTQITATTPANAAGPAQVVVTTPGGSSTDAVFFTYITPAPTVTSVVPNTGPTTGGTEVTITGTGFTGATSVTFGGTPATSFTVNSDTQITATTPANAAGPAQVVVTTPAGSSTEEVFFTYITPAPTVTSVVPNTGPTTGGTEVTITGTGFTGATSVTFGGTPATSFTVNSDTQITATTPANAAGAAQVIVTTPNGSSTDEVFFTYVTPAPTVTDVEPNTGPTSGATEVVITGTGFTGATGVTFGGTPATSFTVNSDTQITASTPANVAGAAPVVVTTPGGSSNNDVVFFYVEAPEITAVSPDQGPESGGNTVIITGSGFTDATSVNFGATPATSFTVNSDTQITATAPAGTGNVQITVTTTGGTSNGGAYAYIAAPVISALSPDQGPESGGTSVTITGTGLTFTQTVNFGASPASFTVLSGTQVVATAPAGTGTVQVTVTTPGGTSNGLPYEYVPAPEI